MSRSIKNKEIQLYNHGDVLIREGEKMKRLLILLLVIVYVLSLAAVVSAEDDTATPNEKVNNETEKSGTELRSYIEEKIMPVIVGVITSVVALLGTLKGLFSALKELKNAKSDYEAKSKASAEDAKKVSNGLKADYNAIKDSVKDVPQLIEVCKKQEEKIENLENTVIVVSKMLCLAYSANSELVRAGKAKEMNRLLSKLDIKGDAQDEII